MHDDFVAGLIRAAIKANHPSILEQVKRAVGSPREFIECHPSIETDIADKDMLLLRIDMALDSGDEEVFGLLTGELKGLGGSE